MQRQRQPWSKQHHSMECPPHAALCFRESNKEASQPSQPRRGGHALQAKDRNVRQANVNPAGYSGPADSGAQQAPRQPVYVPLAGHWRGTTPDSGVKLHEKILKDAGLKHIRFHDLRHPYVKHKAQIFSAVYYKPASIMQKLFILQTMPT